MDTQAMSDCAVITGPPGSGKTRELLRRAVAAGFPSSRVILSSPHPLAARSLGGTTLANFAIEILNAHAFESGLALEVARIADADAEAHFENAAESLFSLEWVELAETELDDAPALDYEIAGLRAPERFAQAAYRLIRKLRGAGITPDRFLDIALRKATDWYAKPPNFANPDLLFGTPERYRDSLDVDGRELDRQRRREIDLAKILAKTYEQYVADAEERGCLNDVDTIAEATRLLDAHPSVAQSVRARVSSVFIDDAQDVSVGELAFLRALYGTALGGVTFAGDADQATRTFAGARPERIFSCAPPLALPLHETRDGALLAFAGEFLRDRTVTSDPGDRLMILRAGSQATEASSIAERVAAEIASGTRPESIAVLVRSLRGARPYVEALLDRGLAVHALGDLDLLAERTVQDALALLWSVHDPFRHDWLLRALATPTVRLSDATLAMLCGEPAQAQAALFAALEEGEDAAPRGRWDRERALRLGRNVTRGDRDADLEPATRERLVRFRERRASWHARFEDAPPIETAARAVLIEGGLFEPEPGELPARSAYRCELLERFLGRIAEHAAADRTRTLGETLGYLEALARSEWPQCEPGVADESAGVHVASIEAVKGRSYESVFVPNLRAGAFPPYWVPDAFVFTTGSGIVPKDNVGDARSSRTAKFTWYMHNAKIREQYGNEDRRLLYCAMTRATRRLALSAWGSPSKGVGAPEFLAEVEGALRRLR